MLIYHRIYAYMYKKEMKMNWNSSGFTKVLKIYFGLYKDKSTNSFLIME